MTRTGERTTVTSEAVLDVALTLFADRGYHGTALSQIAEALELRVPSLYNHMQSKHGLLLAIVNRTVTGVSFWVCGARVRVATSADGVNVPVSMIPFA